MRQIGTILNETDAQRFAAYLFTQKIAAHVEQEPEGWVVWVRDEDQMELAKDELEQFRVDPSATRYQGAVREADTIRRDEVRRWEEVRKNIHVMGARWRTGTARKAPLTITLIIMSIAVAMMSNFGANQNGTVMRQLRFCDTVHTTEADWPRIKDTLSGRLIDIKRGQIWRLVTPIVVHYGTMHLVFNMYMLYVLGRQVEDRRGTGRYALLVLTIAVTSTFVQCVVPYIGTAIRLLPACPAFYGLFGYMWMKSQFDPSAGLHLSQSTIIFLTIWLFGGIFGITELLLKINIANWGHGIGIVTGIAIGYAPVLIKELKNNN